MQCGALGIPEKAIWVDEDGEPACAMHRLKKSVESAAPSPLPTTKKETAAMESGKCGGYGKREGNCGVALSQGNRTGLCSKCYANKNYHDLHPKAAVKKARKTADAHARIDRLTDHVNREIGVAEDVPLHARITGSEGATNERVVSIQLGESKVQKLLDLLLQ